MQTEKGIAMNNSVSCLYIEICVYMIYKIYVYIEVCMWDETAYDCACAHMKMG